MPARQSTKWLQQPTFRINFASHEALQKYRCYEKGSSPTAEEIVAIPSGEEPRKATSPSSGSST
eukprot:3636522-Amphidinium_carterae.1